MFEQVDALPGAQHQPAAHDRHVELHLRQRGLEVRRHVVRPFVVVFVETALGRQIVEEFLEVVRTAGAAFSWISSEAEV